MFWNLLADTAESASEEASKNGCTVWSFLPWIIVIGIMFVFYFFNKRSQKKREQELNDTLDAIQPGNKVKTIGGICGVVVEVCPEDNTFILETGSEESGKSYIKFDKKAVYQTDATATPAVSAEGEVETPAEETAAEPIEDAPFEEDNAPEESKEE